LRTRSSRRGRSAEHERETAAKILALPDKQYGVIYGDPEWRFEVWNDATGLGASHEGRLSGPYLTFQRSWMLWDRAFGQFASTCRSSGSLASPYFSLRRATS
jgi:hypothetical protein